MNLFAPLPGTIQPRKYQLDAFQAGKTYLEYREGNPCVVLPTGAGKTSLIGLLCQWVQSWGGRVLILAHVKELLQQAADKLSDMAPGLDVGMYSAGLNSRDKRSAVTVAGIQSVYNRAREFEPFDLVIVDECHLLPPDGEGMYRSFLAEARKLNVNLRLVGLTATPYRMSTGMLCGPDELLRAICYEIGVLDLINAGYLSKLVSKHAGDCDTSGLHVRGGEFVAEEVSLLMGATDTVRLACDRIIAAERKSVLVFCSGVEHATQVTALLPGAELVTGETTDRHLILDRFKRGETRYLVNVNVLTTGFDAPNVDCVALLRPTLSPGLYYQMCGRGFRLSPDKQNCMILDFGGNIERHGPINALRITGSKSKGTGPAPVRLCPECDEVVPVGVRVCPDCGYQWPLPETVKHDYKPGDKQIIDESNGEEECKVLDVKYGRHVKKGSLPEHPATLRVDYQISIKDWKSEWVCIEHDGFAGNKAKLWWAARSNDPFPRDVFRAVEIAEGGGLAVPLTLRHKPDGEYTRITAVELGPKPEAVPLCPECQGNGCEACKFEFVSNSTISFEDLPF